MAVSTKNRDITVRMLDDDSNTGCGAPSSAAAMPIGTATRTRRRVPRG
jgi:hypothetical protein